MQSQTKWSHLPLEDMSPAIHDQILKFYEKQTKGDPIERREDDPDFADRWDDIVEAALDNLEQEAYRRAYDGVDKPVFYKGDVCGYIKEKSDALLMFILRAGRPEKYRERHEVKNTGVSKIEVVYVEQAPDGENRD